MAEASWQRYLRDPFTRRTSLAAAIRIGGIFCGFALQLLLARLLGSSEIYGEYVWGQSFLLMSGTLVCMGLPLIVNQYLVSLRATNNHTMAMETIWTGQRLVACSSLMLVACGLLLAVADRHLLAHYRYTDVIVVALIFSPVVAFTTFYQDVLRAHRWLGSALFPVQILRPLFTAIFAFFVFRSAGYLTPPVSLALAGFGFFLALIYQRVAFQYCSNSVSTPENSNKQSNRTDMTDPWSMIRAAIPLFATQGANAVLTYSNTLALGFLAGPAVAGTYFAAERLAQFVLLPKRIVSLANQSEITAANLSGNSDLQALATKSALTIFLPTVPAGMALIFFSHHVLQLFGREFHQGQAALVILVAAQILVAFFGPAQDILVMTGRQRLVPAVVVVSALLHLLVLFLLAPLLGAAGAATATLVGGVVRFSWLSILAKKRVGVNPTVISLLSSRKHADVAT